jgi:hypothetical protein
VITSSFIDEVELEVVPIEICGMILGSPYLYDRKAIFYRGQNKYHIFKDGIEFIVRAHRMKTNLAFVTIGHILANASIHYPYLHPMVERKTCPLVDVVPVKKGRYVDSSFSFKYIYSIVLFNLLLINGVWLAIATMNDGVCEFKGMVNLVDNIVPVFIMVMMSQVLVIQARRMDDNGQVRKKHSHLISE